MESDIRIAVVGPCASGKSSLAAALRMPDITVKTPAQEHSHVPDMWRWLTQPDILIFLDADDDVLRSRRRTLTDTYLKRERERLAHAREHADLVLDTSRLSSEEVAARVRAWLAKRASEEKRNYTFESTYE